MSTPTDQHAVEAQIMRILRLQDDAARGAKLCARFQAEEARIDKEIEEINLNPQGYEAYQVALNLFKAAKATIVKVTFDKEVKLIRDKLELDLQAICDCEAIKKTMEAAKEGKEKNGKSEGWATEDGGVPSWDTLEVID